MSSTLLRIASEHCSVVAVVGKGHLQGIKKYWKQPVGVGQYIFFLREFFSRDILATSPCAFEFMLVTFIERPFSWFPHL